MKRGAIEISIGTIVIIILSISMLILGMVLVKNIFVTEVEPINYTFILNNETMDSIMICEEEWHYEKIDNTIPCVINDTLGGVVDFDNRLAPQDISQNLGGFFPGLNLLNDSRAKELYDELIPECFDFLDSDVSEVWLNVSECRCVKADRTFAPEFDYYSEECMSYDCGGGLLVVRK